MTVKKPGDFAPVVDQVAALAKGNGARVIAEESIDPRFDPNCPNGIYIYGDLSGNAGFMKHLKLRRAHVEYLEYHTKSKRGFTGALDYALEKGIEAIQKELEAGDINVMVKN